MTSNRPFLYEWRDGQAVPVPDGDILARAKVFEDREAGRVGATSIKRNGERQDGVDPKHHWRIFVSTVFLNIDHNHAFTGPPVLWETLVFQGAKGIDASMLRYQSRASAEAGHEATVHYVQDAVRKGIPFAELDWEFDVDEMNATERGSDDEHQDKGETSDSEG